MLKSTLFDRARQRMEKGTMAAASTFHPTVSIPRNGSVCSHPVCQKQASYIRGKIDDTQEPCEDFYSYVCSARWSKKDRTVRITRCRQLLLLRCPL